jgi:hypothetical protein
MSYTKISLRVSDALKSVRAEQYADVLRSYRVVHQIDDLDMGKPVRWIRRSAPAHLTTGGIVVDVREDNFFVLCISRIIIKVKFGACIVFQKLSPGELLVAKAYDQEF